MRVSDKVQVIITQKLRAQYGLDPETPVVPEGVANGVLIRPAVSLTEEIERCLTRSTGSAMIPISTDEIMALTCGDESWAQWSRERLAEVSLAFAHERELETELNRLQIRKIESPYESGFAAGRDFLTYRRKGGERRSPLPDFYIGAHASHAFPALAFSGRIGLSEAP